MKANPGYKWCPPTSKPVKQSSTVTNRKKLWAFPSEPAKDLSGSKKLVNTEEMPQLNFAMAGEFEMSVAISHQVSGLQPGCFQVRPFFYAVYWGGGETRTLSVGF